MCSVQVHLARRDQKVPVNQIDDSIREIGREVWSVISATILLQSPGYIYPWVLLTECQLHVGVGFVVSEQNVESRLLLLDQVVLKGQRLFVVGDDDVVDVHRFLHKGSGLGICYPAFMKIGTHPVA